MYDWKKGNLALLDLERYLIYWFSWFASCEGENNPQKGDLQLFLYSLLISQNSGWFRDSFYESIDEPKNSLSKCEVTFMSQHERRKAKRFTNEGKMCLFQCSLLNKALKTTELKQKRHNHQLHSARAMRTGSQSFCMPKVAGASSRQLRMTITCAKIWRRWRRIISWNTSPRYAQTLVDYIICFLVEVAYVQSGRREQHHVTSYKQRNY